MLTLKTRPGYTLAKHMTAFEILQLQHLLQLLHLLQLPTTT